MHNESDPRTALSWQAFLYASAQMSPAEQAAFEDRLDADQQAREVLARVVQLSQVLAALPADAFDADPVAAAPAAVALAPQQILKPTSGWRQPAGWMAVGAAACWLLIAGLHALDRSQSGRGDTSNQPLVLAWSEYSAGHTTAAAEDDGDLDNADDQTAADRVARDGDLVREGDLASDAESEAAAPDWLMSVFSLSDSDGAAAGSDVSDDATTPGKAVEEN